MTRVRRQTVLSLSIVLLFLASQSACVRRAHEPGSKERPLKMVLVPTDDSQRVLGVGQKLGAYLQKSVSQKLYQKDEGFYIDTSVPTSFIAVVEAFGTGRADFGGINTYGYVLLKHDKKYPAEAILRIIRGNGDLSYKAQILVRADSKISRFEDLKNRRFAYTDPASTSGYFVPAVMFKRMGIPFSKTVFAQGHNNVVSMIYQGQVDAGATWYNPPKDGKMDDARKLVLTQFPDVESKVKILGFTSEIPNDPWVLRPDLYKDQEQYRKVKTALIQAMVEYTQTPDGKQVLNDLYGITGLKESSDQEYESIVRMIVEAREELSQSQAQTGSTNK